MEHKLIPNTLNKRNGMLILCGKSQLPVDMAEAGYLDKVIAPKGTMIGGKDVGIEYFNILEGQEPAQFAKLMKDIFGSDGSDPFWPDSAAQLIQQCFVCLQELSIRMPEKYKLTFTRLNRLIGDFATKKTDADGKPTPIDEILDIVECSPDASDTGSDIGKMLHEYNLTQNKADATLSSTLSMARTWMNNFTQVPLLNKWLDSDQSSFELLEVLNGLKTGVALKPEVYGTAGQVIQILVKRRVFNAIHSRGDKQSDPDFKKGKRSRVFVIIDESQDIIGEEDMDILPKARSFDMVAIYATQNIENYINKRGKDQTDALLRSFKSKVMLHTSSETYNLIANDIGVGWERKNGYVPTDFTDRMATNQKQMSALLFDPKNIYFDDVKGYGKRFVKDIKGEHVDFKKWFDKGGTRTNQKTGEQYESKGSMADQYRTPLEFPVRSQEDKPQPIFDDEMAKFIQNNPYHAIAFVNRAKTPRFDIIKTSNDLSKSRVSPDCLISEVLNDNFHYANDAEEIDKAKLMNDFFGEDSE